MRKLEFETQAYRVYSCLDEHYLVIEYLKTPVHLQIVTLWTKVMLIIIDGNLTGYILDARKLGPLSQQSNDYINHIVLPKLLELGVRRAAIIIPEGASDKVVTEKMLENIDTGKFISHGLFYNLEEAELWNKRMTPD